MDWISKYDFAMFDEFMASETWYDWQACFEYNVVKQTTTRYQSIVSDEV